ncbi:MAG TPA: tetratricopeptide repeat protein [Blastocatellia bacterium]|nr:tetratricopeptide repeat protein [Blastocatellia bacterium]
MRDDADGFDLNKYKTGVLEDNSGFVTIPGDGAADQPSNGGPPHAFSYDEALYQQAGKSQPDASAGALAEELEGIDFYIAQGYYEIARDTLNRLREEYGDHPEIIARCKDLGVAVEAAPDTSGLNQAQPVLDASDARPEIDSFSFQNQEEQVDVIADDQFASYMIPADEDASASSSADELNLTVTRTSAGGERANYMPFLVQKESGPLDPDLIVRFNTSELLNDTAFDMVRTETGSLPLPAQARIGTADLLESIASNIESSFGIVEDQETAEAEATAATVVEEPGADSILETAPEDLQGAQAEESEAARPPEPLDTAEPPAQAGSTGADLQQIFEEISGNTGNLTPLLDYETYYSLGLAYKDMELFDEAIEQFQMAFKVAGLEEGGSNHIQCCHMLGVCFKRKQMPRVAVMWFERGLNLAGRPEDEYQALRYEIGLCYEETGEYDKALDIYTEVYGIDVNYRQVGEKIKRLQALKSA